MHNKVYGKNSNTYTSKKQYQNRKNTGCAHARCHQAYVRVVVSASARAYSPLFLETARKRHGLRTTCHSTRCDALTYKVCVQRRTMSMQTTMEQKSDLVPLMNGNGRLVEENRKKPARFWRKIHLNEWTFSLSLLVFSFSIVLGKLFTNYGKLSWQINDQYPLPSVTRFNELYSTIPSLSQFDMKQIPVGSEKFLNASNLYAEAAANVLVTVYGKYDWLLKAMMNGLVLTSFSWFILYKDSSEPGINPPFPFSFSRQRRHEGSRIQLNYLVGALNGLLLFIYMCL